MDVPPVPLSILLAGPDQPGILARLCEVLEAQGCMLADVRVASLVGQCAGVFAVYAPADTTATDLSEALAPLRREYGLRIQVQEAPDGGWPTAGTPFSQSYVLCCEGAHRPEVIRQLAERLAARGCNIVDLEIESSLGAQSNVYALLCELRAPMEPDEARALGEALGRELGVNLTIVPTELKVVESLTDS